MAVAKFATDAYGVAGLKAAIIGYAVLGIIAVICLYFLVPRPTHETEGKTADEKMTMRDWTSVMTDPRTWFSGIAVFATYTMYCTLSYYTPYFSNVLAFPWCSRASAIFRQYGTRFIGAPVGGWLLGD